MLITNVNVNKVVQQTTENRVRHLESRKIRDIKIANFKNSVMRKLEGIRERSFYKHEKDTKLNSFITEAEWRSLEIDFAIQVEAFLYLHKGVKAVGKDVTDFLRDNNWLWEFMGGLSDAVGNLVDATAGGPNQHLEAAAQGAFIVTTLLSKLKQDNKPFEYYNEFVITIFSRLSGIVGTRDIDLLIDALSTAKSALESIDYKWTNFLTLFISRSNASSLLERAKGLRELALNRLLDEERQSAWGNSWY
ncbi:hypothetical protein E1I18_03510 [Mycoplasmopsis mucosicanis]|uniref:Uncharacterized protein n=1 Tax=Mycoplasmopsis mucosicanis TaxID=458208 RepID=A0A507SHM5_9BACT|nr:hypothetical protein [Mycoplasmopsis mucosicanis]TQC51267.1 hypothetical protein E1I18_03510 [Mycoplasmopsis mucosicanis]